MKNTLITFLLFITLISSSLWANDEIPAKPVETSLQSFSHQGEHYLVLSFKNKPHWHTYWKNPGDAGLPTKVDIQGIKTQELEWTFPKKYMEKGEILAFGYSDEHSRFFKVVENKNANLVIKSNWLVCKNICIPGKIEIKANYKDHKVLTSKNDFQVKEEIIKVRFKELPKVAPWPQDLDLKLVKGEKENTLGLFYRQTDLTSFPKDRNFLTPFMINMISYAHEKIQGTKAALNGHLPIEWDGEYEEPPVALPKDGIFKTPKTFKFLFINKKGEALVISKTFKKFQTENTKGPYSFFKPNNNKSDQTKQNSEPASYTNGDSKEKESLLFYLLFAFIGGLILNVMPCVLPVISLKLFGLVSHSNESPKSILKHNIFYTLGVLSTFFALATAIIMIKSTGESVGWGFQLQSPTFITIMIIGLFIMGLNLFGLFEFQTPGGRNLGNVQLKDGLAGDFMGGVLATILSTPCSAPFLGTALTFAFTSSNLTIFLIFTMIGLGLSFPFLMTGLFPKTISFLPKPGMWMEHVKKFLGLTLFLTCLWLIDVFMALVESDSALLKLNAALLLFFFAFYLQKNITKKVHWKIIFFSLPIMLVSSLFLHNINTSNTHITTSNNAHTPLLKEKRAKGLDWRPWSEEAMKELVNQEKFVFIDFTAKWCFTCKVNEKLVLETDGFKKLIKENNISLLLGDWTKKDAIIGGFLKRHDLVGVPAYFIQKPSGELIKLGETISISEIKRYLKR